MLVDPGGLPFPGLANPWECQHVAFKHKLLWKPNCSEPMPPIAFFFKMKLLQSGSVSTCPQGQVPYNQTTPGPTEILQLANPKLAYPALPIPSSGNHNKGFHHVLSSLLLPPDKPWCLPVWPPCSGMPLFREYSKLIFSVAIVSWSFGLAEP